LKDFNLTLGFKGKLKWRGKKSRLEIIYNDARRSWYAHIPVEVVNIPETKGDLRASVDLGHILISLNETDLSHEKRNRNFASEGGGIRERLSGRFK
jgi:transposase